MQFQKGKMGLDHVNKDDRLHWGLLDSSGTYWAAGSCNGLYCQGGQNGPGGLVGPDGPGGIRGLVRLIRVVRVVGWSR